MLEILSFFHSLLSPLSTDALHSSHLATKPGEEEREGGRKEGKNKQERERGGD